MLNIINKLAKSTTTLNISVGLAVALVVLITTYLLASLLYHPKKIIKRGYKVEMTVKKALDKIILTNIGGVNIGDLPGLEGSKKAKIDIGDMIKKADISKGIKVFKKCAVCHTIKQGAKAKIGPNLFGVIGRKKASIVGFHYSDDMKNKGGRWNHESLNQFLTKPRNYISGTKMSFGGLKKDKDRANVIAYLEASAKN